MINIVFLKRRQVIFLERCIAQYKLYLPTFDKVKKLLNNFNIINLSGESHLIINRSVVRRSNQLFITKLAFKFEESCQSQNDTHLQFRLLSFDLQTVKKVHYRHGNPNPDSHTTMRVQIRVPMSVYFRFLCMASVELVQQF